jgi:hypothetical protein
MAYDLPIDVNPMPIREADCSCEQSLRLTRELAATKELLATACDELGRRDEHLADLRERLREGIMVADLIGDKVNGALCDAWDALRACADVSILARDLRAILAPRPSPLSPEVKP